MMIGAPSMPILTEVSRSMGEVERYMARMRGMRNYCFAAHEIGSEATLRNLATYVL